MSLLRRWGPAMLACLGGFLLLTQPPSIAQAEEPAAAVVAATPDPLDVTVQLLDAVQHGHGWLAAALALSLVVAALRGLAGQIPALAILKTDRAGVILTLAGALAGAFAHTLAAGQPIGTELVMSALRVGLGAIGGYVGLRRLLISPAPTPATGSTAQ